jgi:hypothetical protein
MQIMRWFFIVICSMLISPFSYSQKKQSYQQNNRRIERILNSNWTFNYFPVESSQKNYESFGFDDSKWPVVSIPHVWRTYETTGEMDPFIPASVEDDNMYWWTGWGWYRKRFSLNKEYFGRKVFLEFEGIQRNCKVWLNGKLLGEHKGTQGPFDFDVTSIVKPEGSDNVLVIAVNNFQENTVPFTIDAGGNSYEYGGIVRYVRLVLRDQLHIPMQGSATHEGGTFVTTPSVSEKEAVIRVQTWVRNDYTVKKVCTLQTTILDSYNKAVQVISSQNEINPGQTFMFDQTLKPIKTPKLWSPENPYLYSVRSEVIDGNSIVDVLNTPLGIRMVTWDNAGRSLAVNGKKVELKGGNRIQDYPWLGAAVPDWIAGTDLQEKKEKDGINFIRTINNADYRIIYEQASKSGILIDAEILGIRDQKASSPEIEQKVKETVRSLRNYPAVVLWNVAGETGLSAVSRIVQTEDPTRTAVQGRIKPDLALPLHRIGSDNTEKQAGEAARIILTSSTSKLSAGKGSVVIITASATDVNGNPVNGIKRNLRWTVSGPAVIAGPADFEGDDPGKTNSSARWYKGFPAVNIIRSTGLPGKVKVTVFSSGIVSGSIEFNVEDSKPDFSVIKEQILSDEGRKPVSRLIINLNRLDEVPKEIAYLQEPLSFTPGDRIVLQKNISDFIKSKNPSADTSSVEFRSLTEILAVQLQNNGARMSAEDFNYNADHFNNCRLILSYIMATKLPPLYKETLRKYYSKSVIVLGSDKNAGDEMNWLNWIPSGGQVVIIQDDKTKTGVKGVVYTRKTDLNEIIVQIYPQYASFSEEGKERALTFINKMNPYIDEVRSGGALSYSARSGEMILIPLYKFISE